MQRRSHPKASKQLPEALYWEVCSGSGPYLLLVHGILSSRAQWTPNIEPLSKVVTPVIVELYGHGRSPSPETPYAYTPEGYTKAFEKIRQELGARRWFICGQSLGARLTLHYALSHPHSIQAQVFTNTNGAFAENDIHSKRNISREKLAKLLLEKGAAALENIPAHPLHARSLPNDIKAALVEDAANLNPLGIANTLRYTSAQPSLRNKIHANRVPALLVCGRYEKRFKISRDFVAWAMPHLEIVDLNAGHAVNLGDVEGFNTTVTTFLRSYQ